MSEFGQEQINEVTSLLMGDESIDTNDSDESDSQPERYGVLEESEGRHERKEQARRELEAAHTEQPAEPESQESNGDYGRSEGTAAPSQQGTNTGPINPQHMMNAQQVEQGYHELQSTMQQIEGKLQRNEISHEQYQNAQMQAQRYAMGLKEQSLAIRENQMNHNTRIQQYHEELAKSIPAWSNPKKRDNIQKDMSAWAKETMGVTDEQIQQWGRSVSPVEFKMAYDSFRLARQGSFEQRQKLQRAAQKSKDKKLQAREQAKVAPHAAAADLRAGDAEGQIDAISQLLMGGG